LAQGIRMLGPTPDQARQAIARLTEILQQTTDGYALEKLAQAIAALDSNPDQAAHSMARLIEMLQKEALEKKTNEFKLQRLARGIVALAPRITSERTAQATMRLVEAIEQTTNVEALEALLEGITAFTPKLGNDNALAMFVFELLKLPWIPRPQLQEALKARTGQTTKIKQSFQSFISESRTRFRGIVDFEKPPQSLEKTTLLRAQ